ncbi:MAG: alpha/beta hydrolase [Candidatus Nealsonbacteria bacterium]|nr:alpha/beta hydrolase [Candidatus Nealsonbacteria bacterium]
MADILILHGWGSCAKNWRKVKDTLEKEEHKVFLPDLPGFGESSALVRLWSMDDYIDWVRNFCLNNNLSQFVLLGHSFGGGIAAKYALKFPKELKKLILVDAAIIRVKDPGKEVMAKIAKIIKTFSFLPFYSFIRRAFYKFMVKSDYPDTEGVMRETYLKAVRTDISGTISSISCPTLLIWGEKDDITPLKDAYLIKERIKGAKLEILPDIRHNPQSENPELLVQTIVKHI